MNIWLDIFRNLAWDRCNDALSPYGRVVYGFQLIEGWHVRYISFLVIASLFLSGCVVAISTAILQSFEAGLSAGSYALAIAAVTLAALTFLSAIIWAAISKRCWQKESEGIWATFTLGVDTILKYTPREIGSRETAWHMGWHGIQWLARNPSCVPTFLAQ